ncbi:MAG: hypothetical protein Q4D93_05060 [Porphyromonas sp.]|nr:hypothetical protein [Porphyromonas sp.]
MIAGALVIGVAYILKAILYKATAVRERRLEKMGMLGGLHYFLSGSFMLKESGLWVILFAVATVFFVYAIFVGAKVAEVKE